MLPMACGVGNHRLVGRRVARVVIAVAVLVGGGRSSSVALVGLLHDVLDIMRP